MDSILVLTKLFSLPLEPAQDLRPVLVPVLVGNTSSEPLHIGDCLDAGVDESGICGFEAFLRWKICC